MVRGHYIPRPTACIDVGAGETMPLSALLADLAPEVRRVYLVGPRPGDGTVKGMFAWLADPAILAAWDTAGSHLDPDTPAIRLKHRATERRLELYRAAQWFGDGSYTAAEAGAALTALQSLLERAWPGSAVLSTPSVTGRALWDLSRPPGVTFPPLDDETQALIRRTAGQGRIELCAVGETAPGFHYLDGRLMYAALCRELPGALVSHDSGDELIPYQRARYRVRFTVPREWAHVGLFMVPEENTRDGWHYPVEPGGTWEAWADGVEVELARAYNWRVDILERLTFETARPLDTWARKLIELRERVGDGVTQPGDRVTELARDGLRNIILHTIGGFARRERVATRLVSSAELATLDGPLHAAPSQVRPGVWLVQQPEDLPARLAPYQHPEWSAAVWARARSRMLWHRTQGAGALTVPRADVLAFQTDALCLAHDPGWTDTGAAGYFRRKWSIDEPVPAPQSWDDLEALKDRAAGEVQHGTR